MKLKRKSNSTQADTADYEPNGLEERTYEFAKDVRAFVRTVPVTISNREDVKQLVRASGSVAANFIEAVEAVGSKDYVFRLRICRKEAKESRLWLRLLTTDELAPVEERRIALVQEALELTKIMSSIIRRPR